MTMAQARRYYSSRKGSNAMPSRIDMAIMVLLILATGYLEFNGEPNEQPASLTDPALQKPKKDNIISNNFLLSITFILPPIICIILHLPNPLHASLAPFSIALFTSNVFTIFTTNVFKLIVGRPRPFFATVCQAYDPADSFNCTGNADVVRDARKSFPSGHTSLAFSAGVFLSLYIAMHLGLWKGRRSLHGLSGGFIPLVFVVAAPVFAAGLIAASRLVDFHHHYGDVIAGACLGTFNALLVFAVQSPTFDSSAALPVNDESDDVALCLDGDGEEV